MDSELRQIELLLIDFGDGLRAVDIAEACGLSDSGAETILNRGILYGTIRADIDDDGLMTYLYVGRLGASAPQLSGEPHQRLHQLLHHYLGGLAVGDISVALGMSPDPAKALLEKERKRGAISEEYENGAAVYRYDRKLPPEAPPSAQDKSVSLVPADQKRLLAFAGMAIAACGLLIWMTMSGKPTAAPTDNSVADHSEASPSSGTPQEVPAELPEFYGDQSARGDDGAQVEAEVRAQQELRAESENREDNADWRRRVGAIRAAAASANCDSLWANGDDCYIGGRLMGRDEFEDEIEEMESQIR